MAPCRYRDETGPALITFIPKYYRMSAAAVERRLEAVRARERLFDLPQPAPT
jgi:hypothetical protein